MKIEVDTLCDACEKCSMFELDETIFYADFKPYMSTTKCKNLDMCKNAIAIWQKRTECPCEYEGEECRNCEETR